MLRRSMGPLPGRQRDMHFCGSECTGGTITLVLVRQLERDLPELLAFFSFPRHLWRKLLDITSAS